MAAIPNGRPGHTFWDDVVGWLRTAGDRMHEMTTAAGGWFGKVRSVAVAVVALALLLRLVQSMLYVPAGWGVEDFLGWQDPGPDGPIRAMREIWNRGQLLWLAQAYLVLDTVLFVPLYAGLFLGIGRWLDRALRRDANTPRSPWWSAILWLPILALVEVDLVENLIGLVHAQAGLVFALAIIAIGALLVHAVPSLRALVHRPLWVALLITAVVAAAVLAGVAAFDSACTPRGTFSWSGQTGCGAHRSKLWLAIAASLVLLVAAAFWLFGILLPDDPRHRPERLRRAALRSAIADCLFRSRYVLAAIVLMAGLTVVMDQSRDVIASSASFVPRIFAQAGWHAIRLAAGAGLAFGLSALALGLLVFACWLWTRSACQLRGPVARASGLRGRGYGTRYANIFARDWARVVSLLPVALVVLLCAQVLEDLARAQTFVRGADGQHWNGIVPSLGVLLFAGLCVFAGVAFIWQRSERHTASNAYYDSIDWTDWRQRIGLPNGHETGRRPMSYVAFWISPYALPILAMVLALMGRLIDVWPVAPGSEDFIPSLAFPIILLSLAFWLCFFGWLSLLEIHGAVPWVLTLVLWIGLAGYLGVADNHIVWSGTLPGAAWRWGAVYMLVCTALVGLTLLLSYRWAMGRAADRGPLKHWQATGAVVLLVATLAGAIGLGNLLATARRPQPGQPFEALPADSPQRPLALDAALAAWLDTLCNSKDEKAACKPVVPLTAAGGLPVYFVSTEGGGIRAAAWTAMALHQQELQDPHFRLRTFSISGVSGGAIGAAVYRACAGAGDAKQQGDCVRNFAQTDLLSPLVGAWMFEDLIGRIVPSGWCNTPGCGFMSRGAWFEQTMESAAPRLRRGLIELRRDDTRGAAPVHVPYLLLNATWVETGERAIASELRIDQADFPGSKDQLDLLGTDMPLGAAAHNAARFPYINAIGGLRTPVSRCDRRAGEKALAPAAKPVASKTVVCGHLADGGYFDNGGAQTTSDVIHALVRCLDKAQPCPGLPDAHRDWLRKHLVPTVLMIRNESKPDEALADQCTEVTQPTKAEVDPAQAAECAANIGDRYRPGRPICERGKVPYLDLVGPALAVFNTSGIGAAGRLAEARQATAIAEARQAMGSDSAAARQSDARSVIALDLLPKGVKLPLGWHLSRKAVGDIESQAKGCRIGQW